MRLIQGARAHFRRFAAVVAVLTSSLLIAHADVLAGHTANPGGNFDSGTGYYGQGFTVSGTGTFDNVTFSFLSATGTPYAIGTGYLFTSPYAGTPSGLASSSYLGSAVASGNIYTFSPSLDLTGGQTYYFYEDTLPAGNAFGIDASTGTAYYFANGDVTFANFDFTDDFVVNGDPVAATPEPSSIALLGTGLLGFAGVIKRRICR